MGNTGCVRRVFGNHRPAADLGPGTPGALLHDLHASTVEELAGERSIHHCRILRGACVTFHRKTDRIPAARLVDDTGNPALDTYRGLHSVPVCPGQGARPLAESAAATALARTGAAAWVGSVVANGRAGPGHA